MKVRPGRWIIVAVFWALNLPAVSIAQGVSEGFEKAARQSYIYGLGVVAMYRYYSGMALQEDGLNKLVHSRSFIEPGDKPGSAPNVDTFYSYGWFDLSEEPMVVSLPAFGDRYYVYQMNDIYGHNFHNVGNSLSSGQVPAYAAPPVSLSPRPVGLARFLRGWMK